MPLVQVYHQIMDDVTPVCEIKEDLFRRHSRVAEFALSREPGPVKRLVFRRVEAGAIQFILNKIKGRRGNRALYVRVHELPLKKVVDVYEALERMQIDPPQPHVENFITGYISHNRVTPVEFRAVYGVFDEHRDTSKVLRTLIHQMAWNLINKNYTDAEVEEFRVKVWIFPTVDREIKARMDELAKRPSVAAKLKAQRTVQDAAGTE